MLQKTNVMKQKMKYKGWHYRKLSGMKHQKPKTYNCTGDPNLAFPGAANPNATLTPGFKTHV